MKKMLLLMLITIIPIICQCAENESTSVENNESEKTVVLQGEIRILSDYVYTIAKLKADLFSQPWPILQQTYNLGDDDIVIGIDYHSQECDDWDHQRHPKLGDHQLCAYLPALKPFAYKAACGDAQDIQQKLKESNNLPAPINSIIAQYAQKQISLLDCRHGDVIKFRLPINGLNAQAILTCTKRYRAPFHLALRLGLITSIQLPKNIRGKIEKEQAQMEKEWEELCKSKK